MNDDDMVISVRLEEFDVTAERRAKQDQQRDNALKTWKKRLGGWKRLRKHAKGALTKAVTKSGQAALRGAGSAIGRFAGRGAVSNPVGLIVALGVIAAVTATRLISGKSFDQMGEEVNRVLLGDMDDEARAKMTTRSELESNQDLMRVVAATGKDNKQVKAVFKDIYDKRLLYERNASMIRQEFGVNSSIDMIILRIRDLLVQGWKEAGGDAAMQQFGMAWNNAHQAQQGVR